MDPLDADPLRSSYADADRCPRRGRCSELYPLLRAIYPRFIRGSRGLIRIDNASPGASLIEERKHGEHVRARAILLS